MYANECATCFRVFIFVTFTRHKWIFLCIRFALFGFLNTRFSFVYSHGFSVWVLKSNGSFISLQYINWMNKLYVIISSLRLPTEHDLLIYYVVFSLNFSDFVYVLFCVFFIGNPFSYILVRVTTRDCLQL